MTRWDDDEFTANDLLLDRELIDSRGMPAGRVDDLELTVPGPGEPPVLTVLLSSPTAARCASSTRWSAAASESATGGEHAMRGPWPFPQLFRYLARRSLAVPWSEITAVNRPRIDISAHRDQLQPARRRQ